MARWKTARCPRCGGNIFVDKDMDSWYEQCINCSHRTELKAVDVSTEKPITKDSLPLKQS